MQPNNSLPEEGSEIELLPVGYYPGNTKEHRELQVKRKEEGRCIDCGELRQITFKGLEDCKVCI